MILRRCWLVLRALAVPLLMLGLAYLLLREPLISWLQGDELYDQEALTEWVREARIYQTALPELADNYLHARDHYLGLKAKSESADPKVHPSPSDLDLARQQMETAREQIKVHVQVMCDAVTKVYPGRLPLFAVPYSLTIRFDDALGEKPLVWDSGKPRQLKQYRELPPVQIHPRGVWVQMQYQVHVYARRQLSERQAMTRWRWLGGLGLLLLSVASVWFFLGLRRQRYRELRRLQAEQQAGAAERLHLQEALKRQEAEQKQQDAERTALELRSQLFANIGIMAGSYAHNIKNLLVRPNDLLGRCLEDDGLSPQQGQMLHEVRDTLGTVTERLQQILQTVRRDPSRSERERLDLNALTREMHQMWHEMAASKWKMDLYLDLAVAGEPLWIEGDHSHLQQALENLLFNARDATFEKRNYLRDQARKATDKNAPPPDGDGSPQRRQALIAAASWKGEVYLRTRREGDKAVLEIEDNGIGMTEEVRRRCKDTHFSTKRNNALFAGLSAGMGLGLSFVAVILEHHKATMEVISEPLRGAQFRVTFAAAP
ncbi:MAG TPA: HAMP domain-containing sensor histidine kinase [Gemmataceae bacterium]|nr:HAMP domain-containing sensor histidine kinase [Gemmataceae bacterium]